MSRRESPFHLEIAGATNIGGRRANEDTSASRGARPARRGETACRAGPQARSRRNRHQGTLRLRDRPQHDLSVPIRASGSSALSLTFTAVYASRRRPTTASVGMATTLACAMERGQLLLVGHVGESRVDPGPRRSSRAPNHRASPENRTPRCAAAPCRKPGSGERPQRAHARDRPRPEPCPRGRPGGLRANDGDPGHHRGLTAVVDDQTRSWRRCSAAATRKRRRRAVHGRARARRARQHHVRVRPLAGARTC